MKKANVKRIISFMAAVVMLVACFSGTVLADDWDVIRGEVDYAIGMEDSANVFVCNKGTIGSKVGTEYYMTYTVESMQMKSLGANGVMGTNQPSAKYPYVDSDDGKGGRLHFTGENLLLKEGYTYFLKFTITEDGYKYRMGWAKGDESEYIKFGSVAGEVNTDSGYFGVWFGNAGMNGKLTRVRIYDKKGNDLGVQVTPARNASVVREQTFAKDTEVDHRYTIVLDNVYNIALSNKRLAVGDKVYMEYKVKSSDSKVYQVGGILSDSPTAVRPYLTGHMIHKSTDLEHADNGPFLVEGAEYLFVFEKKSTYFDVIAQRTLNGQTEIISMDIIYGTYDQAAKFISLWFAGGEQYRMNAVLEDFKCYDASKNNLGIQCNSKDVSITHYGEVEDYSGCEALYFNEEETSLYALYEDKTFKFIEAGETQEGTYKVKETTMTIQKNGEEHEYEYMYYYFTDTEGKEYRRLLNYKIIFDTRGGTEIEPQVLNTQNGYQAMKPTDPTMEGNTFEGWYTSDGEEFDFDKIVTDSQVVYAKWEKPVEYTSLIKGADYKPYVFVGIGILIVLVSVVVGIIIVVKEKRYENKG